jgi:hypothetical protein
MGVLLDVGDVEELERVRQRTDVASLSFTDRSAWLYAAVVAGKPDEVLPHEDWLTQDVFDTRLTFALAALEKGDSSHAAAFAREAAERPLVSNWSVTGMHHWATNYSGASAPAVRKLDAAMAQAQRESGPSGLKAAAEAFAQELEAK